MNWLSPTNLFYVIIDKSLSSVSEETLEAKDDKLLLK